MSRRGLEKHLLFIAIAPALVVALVLATIFMALRIGDIEAAGLAAAAAAAKRQEVLIVTLLAALSVVALAGTFAWRLVRQVVLPARRIEVAMNMIRSGNYGIRLPGRGAQAELELAINGLALSLTKARQQATAELAAQQAELLHKLEVAQAMLDAQARSGVGLAIVEYGRIVFANTAVERMSGYDLSELQAMSHFVELAHPDDRERIMLNHFKELAGKEGDDRYDFVLLRRDGSLRDVQFAQTSIASRDGPRMLVILLDITDRKQTEAQLAEAHRQLVQRTEEAERTSLAKSRFLVAASHDLRQPLHALSLFAAEFETTAATPDQKRLAGQIGAATGAMGELLDALLEVSRLDTADIRAQRQRHALGPLLKSVVEAQRSSAEAKGLSIACVATKAWTESDPQLLRRLLGNLVSNAVRYTHTGGIVVGARREGDGLRIEVWDSGIGIEAVQLPLVFQEFYQVANRERDAGKGLGLGLAIVDRIARLLGHRLQVRSTPQRGTVFGLSIPRVEAAPIERIIPAPAAPAEAVRILVAGEVVTEVESLGNLIESWGYRALRANDEGQLRKHMAAMPDVVVCDESLIKGLAQSLTGRPRRPQAVLVGDMEEAELPGGFMLDGRLAKPIKPGRLRALLHHLVEEAPRPSEGAAVASPTL